MLRKNITEKFAFVISFALLGVFFSACHSVSSSDNRPANAASNTNFSADYEKPVIAGRLESDEITESSGLAASFCQTGVLWTHNDSGNKAEIFALDRKGKNLGKWTVAGAKNTDWEDIAAFKNANGECYLYIGDIGNNSRKRGELIVYVVKEPSVSGESRTTEPSKAVKFVYPEFRHDAETLLVHPTSGEIYVLSKRLSGAAAVYRLKNGFNAAETQTLEKIADFAVPAIPNGFLTGGSISPDGKRVLVCDYFNAYEIKLPEKAKNFDEIWSQKPAVIELGAREIGEAVTYSADGAAIYATSEQKKSSLNEVRRK